MEAVVLAWARPFLIKIKIKIKIKMKMPMPMKNQGHRRFRP